MFRKESQLTPLELRKRLLIAESNLNRAQLSEDWAGMTQGVLSLGLRARNLAAGTASAAVLVTGLVGLRPSAVKVVQEKVSWLERALKGAELAFLIWNAFHGTPTSKPEKETNA